MINHHALIRTFVLNKIHSEIETDRIIESLKQCNFEYWDQIESTFFSSEEITRENRQKLKLQWLEQIDKIKADKDYGIEFVGIGEDAYPKYFHRMLRPPLLISYIGNPVWKTYPCLAVVGSREPHPYTVSWLKYELREFIKTSEVAIVSGGARGVDFLAHTLAVDVHKPTVVVVPSGLRTLYPSKLNSFVPQVLQTGGCVISEYESNFEMRKHLFSHRNRIIAAMNHALLIGEANLQSGTMMTANLALEMNKPVWVVPGHPLMKAFAGSLDIVLYGGQMVRNSSDLKIFFETECH